MDPQILRWRKNIARNRYTQRLSPRRHSLKPEKVLQHDPRKSVSFGDCGSVVATRPYCRWVVVKGRNEERSKRWNP
jgi:hypothetical protein